MEEIIGHLMKKLPFTVNMHAAIRDYRERSRILVARRGNYILGVLVEFRTTYNRHVWLDPIVWITGTPEVASALLEMRGYEPSIVISECDFSPNSGKFIPEMSVYQEFVMTASLENPVQSNGATHGNTRQLHAENARNSLSFSGYADDEIDPETLRREENFLNERICLGHYVDGELVSRGAIMSTTGEYATVGAFFTLESKRGQGYGTEIISEVMKMASLRSRKACLFVRSTNDKAISVYRKLGFEIHGTAFFTDLGTGSAP